MTKALNPLSVQRLAYVRYLYNAGVEHSNRPSPLSASALLSFHDAVENFLGLTAEHLGVEVKPGITFLEYWGVIKPVMELPGKARMKRLNDTRISLKHHGVFPSAQTIEQAREAVVDFFSAVTPSVFHVEFDQIDMVDLVTQPPTAQLLREAQTHAETGDYIHAMAGLSLAFDALLQRYSGNGSSLGREETPFAFGPTLYSSDRPRRPSGDTEKGLAKVMAVAESAQTALRVVSLGIDFPRYTRFVALTPRVHGYYSGPPRYGVAPSYESLTAEDYAWCRQFVIEAALRAAGADGIKELLDEQMKANWDPKRQWPMPERSWWGAVGSEPEGNGPPEPPIEGAEEN
ncbi:hypothetical protein [Streptomyces sp. NPDC096153]|uniref:hypothetical protein n=1 Tax=Streptomyces sp. NPDC096153 TaxID=3155548 RepID=UPI00332901D3